MRERLPLLISITALLVAVLGSTPLGRAAYASVVPRNSVGTLQLKRNAVTSSKIAPNSVRTGQVVNGSLLSADFKPGQIPQGPKGEKGDPGTPATKLFASVTYQGALSFGTGVTAATRNSAGDYTVTFTQDLSKCVVLAASGQGQPINTGNVVDLYGIYAVVDSIDHTKANVVTGNVSAIHDNGFVIAAFC